MLAGGKNDTAADKCRGVAAMPDIFDRRRDLKIIKIGADKNISRVGGCGPKLELNVSTGVQSHAADLDRICQGGLVHRCPFHFKRRATKATQYLRVIPARPVAESRQSCCEETTPVRFAF